MNYAQLLFPDFSLILCGYLICRYTALNRTVWQPVESLVYYLLFPVLLFQSIVKSPIDLNAASGLMAAGLISGLCGIGLAYALPHLPWLGKHLDPRDHAASAQVAFRFNSFIGLALAERVAGSQGLLMIAVLIGVCVPLFNVAAVWPMARHGGQGFVRELLRNPLILATASGLVANLLGFRIPGWLEPTVSRISAASLALGLNSPTRVFLNYLHVTQDNMPDGGVPTIGLPGYTSPDRTRPWIADAPKVDPKNFYGSVDDYDDVKADMATVRIEHVAPDGTVTALKPSLALKAGEIIELRGKSRVLLRGPIFAF